MVCHDTLTDTELDDFVEALQTDYYEGRISEEEWYWHMSREDCLQVANQKEETDDPS